MTDKFEINEIAIYVRPGSQYFGCEVKILSDLTWFEDIFDVLTGEINKGFRYETDIKIRQDHFLTARPEWLKKKPRPRREIDQIVSWDDCLWRPKTVRQCK